jgi:hypothetical protein
MKRFCWPVLFTLIVGYWSVPSSPACSCGQPAPGKCASLKEEGDIFVGTVVAIENPPNDDPTARDPGTGVSRYHFRIDEKFTDVPGAEVDVYSGRGGADCSFHFKQGEQYFVTPYSGEDGRLSATICSQTERARYAQARISELRARRDGGQIASLYGRLLRSQQPYSSVWDDNFEKPLTKSVVYLRSSERSLSAQTDDDGVFRFYGVPAGKYTVTADLPSDLEIAQQILSEPEAPIELPDSACYEHDVYALPTGKIIGRVLGPEGKPLRSGSVELFRADRYKENERGWWEFQGDEGHFTFDHLSSGDYIIVFNQNNTIDTDAPFPRTFYPGVTDFKLARSIRLQAGQKVLDADFPVSGGRPTRELTVHVKAKSGELEDQVFVFARSSEGSDPFATQSGAHEFRLNLLRGVPYAIYAEYVCERNCDDQGCGPADEVKTDTVTVDGSDDRTNEITLTFLVGTCKQPDLL